MKSELKNEIWMKGIGDVVEVLEKNSCKYFLDTGTLLGTIRNGDFIPWDNDIDLSVIDCPNQVEVIKNISRCLYRQGYDVTATRSEIIVLDRSGLLELTVKFYTHKDGYYISRLNKNQGSNFAASLTNYLDGTIIFKNGYGKYKVKTIFTKVFASCRSVFPEWLCLFIKKCNKVTSVQITIPEEYLFSFVYRELKGVKYKVPERFEEYLSYRYGPGWKIPKMKYDYINEDGAIR